MAAILFPGPWGFQKYIIPGDKTSMLRRLQAQTLPDATPPIGKIHPFSKIAVAFKPLMEFYALWDLETS